MYKLTRTPSSKSQLSTLNAVPSLMPNIRSQVISNSDIVNLTNKMSKSPLPTHGLSSTLKKKSTHMASSGLENMATERTSAQSRAFMANTLNKPMNLNSGTINNSATLKKEDLVLARNLSDFSAANTSEARDRMGGSMRDSLDSSISAGAAKKI